MTTTTGWPDGVTQVDKTFVGTHEISTIVVNEEGIFCYGETMVFDLSRSESRVVAEQRCDPDELTLTLQHYEWTSRLSGCLTAFDTDYEREGRGEIEWYDDPLPVQGGTGVRSEPVYEGPELTGGMDLAGTIRYADRERTS